MQETDNKLQNPQAVSRPASPAAKPHIMRKFPKKQNGKQNMFLVLGALLVVVVGVGTGWFLSGGKSTSSTGSSVSNIDGVVRGGEKSDMEAGIDDKNQFPDMAEGTLVTGGIENEGTHHLEREGGPSKYVYLSSTIVDLESFVGKKVQVWGQTLSGTNAGWLMDVGKVRVIE